MRAIILLVLISCLISCAEAPRKSTGITEVENSSHLNKQAPPECISVFHDFFRYIQKQEPSILTDQESQNLWFSKLLRKAFAEHIKRSGDPKDNPDYPSNGTFVGVWNRPTTFSIIGSRHYDYRDVKNPDDNRAVIDVLYEWDNNASLDNQYPGTKSLRSFVFVFEDGKWKLDDVYTFSDEYASPSSLRGYFSKA